MFLVSDTLKFFFSKLPRLTLNIPFGHMKGVRWLAASANPGQAFGRYEPEHETQFLELLKNTDVLWDVGAHVGWYSLLASKYLPAESQIIAFEPNPNNLVFLNQHRELNNAHNLHVSQTALCNTDGDAFFSDRAQQSQLNNSSGFKVKTSKSDTLISKGLSTPDFIKIDVEGAELEFLLGAENLVKTHRPRILMSAHGYLLRDQCIDWLENYNYDFEHLVSNPTDGDYIFYASPNPQNNNN